MQQSIHCIQKTQVKIKFYSTKDGTNITTLIATNIHQLLILFSCYLRLYALYMQDQKFPISVHIISIQRKCTLKLRICSVPESLNTLKQNSVHKNSGNGLKAKYGYI